MSHYPLHNYVHGKRKMFVIISKNLNVRRKILAKSLLLLMQRTWEAVKLLRMVLH